MGKVTELAERAIEGGKKVGGLMRDTKGMRGAGKVQRAAGDLRKYENLEKDIGRLAEKEKDLEKEIKNLKQDGKPTEDLETELKKVQNDLGDKKNEQTDLGDVKEKLRGEFRARYNQGMTEDEIKGDIEAVINDAEADIKDATLDKMGFFKKVGLVILGYNVLVGGLLESEAECEKSCKTRTHTPNVSGNLISKATSSGCDTLTDPNCPAKQTKDQCTAYCKKACAQDQRVKRAQCLFASNPMGAILAAIPNMAKTPLSIWDNFKYLIIGIPLFIILLISIPLIKGLFTGAETAAGAVGTAMGTRAIQRLGQGGGGRKRGGRKYKAR